MTFHMIVITLTGNKMCCCIPYIIIMLLSIETWVKIIDIPEQKFINIKIEMDFCTLNGIEEGRM